MYCKKCGKENADDSRFCKHCGASLTSQIPAPGQRTMLAPQAAPQPTPAPNPVNPINNNLNGEAK